MTTLLPRLDDAAAALPAVAASSPRGRAQGGAPPDDGGTGLVHRVRQAVVCLGFVALALAQQPGRIVADTKLDLAVDPVGLLTRSLTLWEPEGFAGQVQNQAYGYLFPMGPFFALLEAVGLPAWVVQRLWLALLLSLAFLGTVALARRLRIGTPAAQLVAGLAYALAPRMLTGLGATSIEVLPMALAPWVLVPLVTGARAGSPRRAAALSALAVFCIGGVNAVATAAVLPLAALWLLTRPAGPRRSRLIGWWTGCVALACAWWAGPLLLLGRYSPPFLEFIETADVTTRFTGLLGTLRGTTQWLAYLTTPTGPLWPAGWSLVTEPALVLATVALAAAGLLGLTRPGLPERSWLALGTVAGAVLVGLGHLGPFQGLLAAPLHELLDGVLAPLRNVHKFDPVLRLPLALGLAHLLGRLATRARDAAPDRPRRRIPARVLARAGLAAVVLCLVATASPAVAGRLVAPDGFEAIPGYWRQAADWLADARPSGRALLVPASSFGTYVWGSTADEPLQPLASTPWEVRNAVPLTPAGHIRMLDAIEDRLARGEGSAGLTRALARAGISHLVVRNDLSADAGAARPALVQQALRTSPGLRRVATFGPVYPAAEHLLDRFLDAGLTPRRPAVEIYAVADPAPRAYTTPLAAVATVLGGPDGVLALEEHGLLDGRPAFLPEEPGATGGRTTLVSDAQLRRERAFGRIDAAGSAALTADDPLRLDDPARDYLYPGAELGESVVRFDGATISASSSASDADSFGGAVPAAAPFAALDGDPATAWRPAQRLAAEEAWWRVESAHVLSARSITVRLADDAQTRPPALLRITTEAGSLTVAPADTAAPQTFPLPPGATHLLTIATVPPAPGDPPGAFGLAEVGLPGLDFDRTVVTPASDAGVAGFAFDAATPAAAGCVVDRDGRPRCAEALVRAAEESRGIAREFTVGRAAEYGLTVTALPRAGADLDALIATTARPWGPAVEVSSTVAPDPRAGADALVDGDPRTVWRAAAGDNHPAITLSWAAPRTFDRLRLVTPEDAAGSVPQVIALESDGGRRQTLRLAADGTAQFPPITTARLILTFPVLGEASSFDPYRHTVSPLGVAVGELEIADVPRADPSQIVTLDCGHGPSVELDGRLHRTAVRTTLAGLRALAPVEVTPCDGDPAGLLAAGTHRIVVRGTAAFTVTAATLRRAGAEAGEASRTAARVVAWDREHRVLALPARDEPLLLVVPENANPGWAATLDGTPLTARTVDGWQQGYLVPAGPAGEVHLDFGPGGTYRAALLAGAAAVVLLLAVLLLPVRRPGPPAPRRRQRTGLLVALAFAAGLALVGGVAGLAVLAGVAAFGLLHRGRRLVVLGRLALGALLLGGASLVLLPAGFAEPAGQLLALVALSALVAAVLPGRGSLDRSATRVRHRLSGRSTTR